VRKQKGCPTPPGSSSDNLRKKIVSRVRSCGSVFRHVGNAQLIEMRENPVVKCRRTNMYCVGVVGHRYLANQQTEEFVTLACVRLLGKLKAMHRDLLALSAIAQGSDSIFAEAALACSAQLHIVRPFDSYAADFADAKSHERYERLRTAARCEIAIPYATRGPDAYAAAMHWIIAHSQIVVAVWDGLAGGGIGGTADTVERLALERRAWIHIDVTHLGVRGFTNGADFEA
jgi:hypothetical protein